MGDLGRFKPNEIEEQRKKINRILKDECGRDVLGAMLGFDFTEAPDLSGKAMVKILVPTYKGFNPFMESAVKAMVKHTKQFCSVDVPPSYPSSVIHWTRNSLIAPRYRNNDKFTHVLFVDDDMTPPEDALVRMLRHEKDIVGALCAHRGDPPYPNMRQWNEERKEWSRVYEWKQDALVGESGSVGIGAGMILISKTALDRIADYYLNCEYELEMWAPAIDKLEEMRAKRRAHFEKSGDAMWFQFLQSINGQGEYGEDVSFCYKAHRSGLKVYVDTSIQPGHQGDYNYSIKDFLPWQQTLIEASDKAGWECRLKEEEIIVPSSGILSAIVPVNDDLKFSQNAAASPGLFEIGVYAIPCCDAKSAADAFYDGEAKTNTPWLLYCHQDVSFPANSGRLIEDILQAIPESEAKSTVIGFIGLDADLKMVGHVIDRGNPLNGPESNSAVSIDELAVILHRDSNLRIDPKLGWHLWATDLCLQAKGKARVVRVPVSHNSSSGYTVPPEFHESAKVLLAKYPEHETITTLCDVLTQKVEGENEVANNAGEATG